MPRYGLRCSPRFPTATCATTRFSSESPRTSCSATSSITARTGRWTQPRWPPTRRRRNGGRFTIRCRPRLPPVTKTTGGLWRWRCFTPTEPARYYGSGYGDDRYDYADMATNDPSRRRPESAAPEDRSFGRRSRQHALKFGLLVEPLMLHRAGHVHHDHRIKHIGEGAVHPEEQIMPIVLVGGVDRGQPADTGPGREPVKIHRMGRRFLPSRIMRPAGERQAEDQGIEHPMGRMGAPALPGGIGWGQGRRRMGPPP